MNWRLYFDTDALYKVLAAAAVAAALAALGILQVNLSSILEGHATAQIVVGALITAAIAALSRKKT